MQATRVLPESYSLYHHFDEARFKKARWMVIVLGLLVFVASFVFSNSLAGRLHPEYQPVERLHFELTLERLITLLRLLVLLAVIATLHEGIHALCLWLFTRERPTLVTAFEGVGGIGVRLPSWYLSRNAFLVANLAPVCSMTLAGLLLLPLMAHTNVGLLLFGISVNLAGSTTDVISSIYVYLHPRSAYVKTDGRIYHPQGPETDTSWRRRLRSASEWILARLEQSNGTSPIPADYYTAQAGKLLRQFDRAARHYRPVLVAHLAGESPDEIIRESRREFGRLLPAIPYIGGRKNSLTRILVGCTMSLALYRVLKERGRCVEEIGRIMVEIEESRVRAYPRFLVGLAGWYIHTPLGRRRLKRMMVEHSQEHAYPSGWVATFVEGDGQTFDFGMDYTECALVKFCGQQGAGEFTRYLCLIDYVQQRAMGTGFFRTTTLAEGGERCDFRWKKGGETRPAWPPPWPGSPEEKVTA